MVPLKKKYFLMNIFNLTYICSVPGNFLGALTLMLMLLWVIT